MGLALFRRRRKWTSPVKWADRIPRTNDYISNQVMNVELDHPGSGRFLTIPPGERFNLSVPFLLTWIQSRHDPDLLRMALAHDYMLKNRRFDRAVAAAQARLIARGDASAQKAWRAGISMMIATAFK